MRARGFRSLARADGRISRRRVEPRKPKWREIEARRHVQREVGERFADGRRMLEAMAGAWRGDDDTIGLRMRVDEEAEIRRHGVEAGACAKAARADTGEDRGDERVNGF